MVALQGLLVDIHVELKLRDAEFHIGSKYDNVWVHHRLGLPVESSSIHKLRNQYLPLLGPLHRHCLSLLSYVLAYCSEALEMSAVQETLVYLSPEDLKYENLSCGLIFRDNRLTYREALPIANLYELRGGRRDVAWILEKLLECRVLYKLTLGQEHGLLKLLERFADLASLERAGTWVERKREIEDMWTGELEAAIPDDNLAAACNLVSHTPR